MYRLLIADGSAAVRASIRALLPKGGSGLDTVAEADSFEAAVDLALDIRPHAALVSRQLGDRTGNELIRLLRSAGLETAFCVVSDSGGAERILQAMRAGASDFLLTPVDAGEVTAFLDRVLPGAPAEDAGVDPILQVDRARLSGLTNKILLLAHNGMEHPPVSLTSIAAGLHMNSKYLGRVFLRDTGMKLSEYMTACRMEQARRLLAGTQEKITVIARTVGYSQPNRFYVHFKAYFGVSPGELRRENQARGGNDEISAQL